MEIVEYEPSMASDLAATYNHATRYVPHCYPVDVKTFSATVAAVVGGKSSHKRLHSESLFVGMEGESILGFIHTAVEKPKDKKGVEQGSIRFFWYAPGQRSVGQQLLAAAEDYLCKRRLSRVVAFHQDFRYPFYCFKHAYLSEHLGHVQALLQVNGYEPIIGEVFLDWLDFEPIDPPPIDLPIGITVNWVKGHGKRPGLHLKATLGEKEIGTCECVSCGEYSNAQAVQDWFFTEWLGIAEEHRGRGLGRHLLRRALKEMHGAGYRNASISTDWKNARAFVFYSNFGYQVADWTYAYGRELKQDA